MASVPNFSSNITRLVIAGIVMFIIGWFARKQNPQGQADLRESHVRSIRSQTVSSSRRVESDLVQWQEMINQAASTEFHSIASQLLASSQRHSIGHWAPLLARWSESDGPGMISFIEEKSPSPIKQKLLQHAWFAWGYADPDAAFLASLNLSHSLTLQLLSGIAEADPLKAAKYVRMVPDSQFAATDIANSIFEADPDVAEELLSTAVYDGGRHPFEKARIKHLAKNDPAEAVAYARSLGVLGWDQVPIAIKQIALLDPSLAATQVENMPSSRSKALSAVELASVWASKDVDAATTWARKSQSGATLHYSLIAAAMSSSQPEKALDLINEAGWESQSDFYNVRDWGSLRASETLYQISAQDAARQLIERVAMRDPNLARTLLETKVPANFRSTIVIGTSIAP